ncbi:MAG: 3-hydroxyacyl-ACP dehydratase FabZ family protein [Planctomycetota bacterium]
MAAEPFLDLAKLDLTSEVLDTERLGQLLPQRGELMMVDGICHLESDHEHHEKRCIVGYKDLGGDDWWAAGHFPGNPIVPGILMIEGAAQVGTVLWRSIMNLSDALVGFGGLEKVRFRKRVRPPARLYFLVRAGNMRRRVARMPAQVIVDGALVLEATIIGVAL